MKNSFIVVVICLLALVSSSAQAATSEVPQTSQSLCYDVTDLTTGTTYYRKVTANDADGGATESESRSFTTQ